MYVQRLCAHKACVSTFMCKCSGCARVRANAHDRHQRNERNERKLTHESTKTNAHDRSQVRNERNEQNDRYQVCNEQKARTEHARTRTTSSTNTNSATATNTTATAKTNRPQTSKFSVFRYITTFYISLSIYLPPSLIFLSLLPVL